jgi:hypothetical protein
MSSGLTSRARQRLERRRPPTVQEAINGNRPPEPPYTDAQRTGHRVEAALANQKAAELAAYEQWKAAKEKAQQEHDDAILAQVRNRGLQ